MTAPHIYKRRLLTLADFLEKLPRRRFDYSTWVGSDWKGAQDLSCGTTACALGWASTMPQFRRLGLNMGRSRDAIAAGYVRLGTDSRSFDPSARASRIIFGLTEYDHRYLFIPNFGGPSYDATPKEVAKHIRRFVKSKYDTKGAHGHAG